MDKTMFRGAVKWGVLAAAAIAFIPAASAEPLSLSATELDNITAGGNVKVQVWTVGHLVKYRIFDDGKLVRWGKCPGACEIKYVSDGTTVRLKLN